MKVKIIIFSASFCFVVLLGIYQYVQFSNNSLRIIFCNVGQGDAIYIRSPKGVDVLIDAGPDSSVLRCLGAHMPFWDKTIELAFATHPDADHIGGYKYVLNSYKIAMYNTVEVSKDTDLFKVIQDQLDALNVPIRRLVSGDTYNLNDGVFIKTYWPTKEFLKGYEPDTNRYSLIQLLNFNNFDLLLSGDADFDIVNRIFIEGIDVDVYKLPHHGSKTGVDVNTFSIVRPQLGIISAGKNNRYGHPHKKVLNELEKHGISFLETKSGDIKIETKGVGFTVRD
ncbi:MAG: hypothetical protein KA035_00110 [Candidatus Levybacteria bacterium]|nr:hypothetical protein [Candidatus Levybacteria bacterium]